MKTNKIKAIDIINNSSLNEFKRRVHQYDPKLLITLFEIALDFHKIYILEQEQNISPYLEIMKLISNKITFNKLKLKQKIRVYNLADFLKSNDSYRKNNSLIDQIKYFYDNIEVECLRTSFSINNVEKMKESCVKIISNLTVLLAKENQEDFITLLKKFPLTFKALWKLNLEPIWKNCDATKNLLAYFSTHNLKKYINTKILTRNAIKHNNLYLLSRIFSKYNNTQNSYLTIDNKVIKNNNHLYQAFAHNNTYVIDLLVPEDDLISENILQRFYVILLLFPEHSKSIVFILIKIILFFIKLSEIMKNLLFFIKLSQ